MKDERPRKLQLDIDRNVGFNKKYTTIALYVILVILFAALLIFILLSPDRLDTLFGTLKSICTPILIGLVIAYLIYPLYRFFEKRVFISAATRKRESCRRALFRAKLRYDFERTAPSPDDAKIERASAALANARKALDEASAVHDAECLEKNAKRTLRNAAKQTRPSYIKPTPSAPSRAGKTLSLISSYLIFLLLITLFVWIILPPCLQSISDLLLHCRRFLSTLPSKLTSFELGRQIRDLLREFDLADDVKNWVMGLASSLLSGLTSLIGRLPTMLSTIVSNLTDALLGIFLSVYFLSAREMLLGQVKRFSRALLPRSIYRGCRHVLYEINRKFGKFIQGKLLSSAILGAVSFLLFWVFGIPYFQMITLIVTVTNLIPFFGPFIGAIPSGIIILISAPDKLIIFIILVLVIQQIEGNILEPYILGDSLGLEPVWIMIAIVVMGELFGIIGMVLGVPFFAVLYTLLREACTKRLRNK